MVEQGVKVEGKRRLRERRRKRRKRMKRRRWGTPEEQKA